MKTWVNERGREVCELNVKVSPRIHTVIDVLAAAYRFRKWEVVENAIVCYAKSLDADRMVADAMAVLGSNDGKVLEAEHAPRRGPTVVSPLSGDGTAKPVWRSGFSGGPGKDRSGSGGSGTTGD